jgi:hypothetical protein
MAWCEQPKVTVREGLSHTIKYFKKELQEVRATSTDHPSSDPDP